MFPRGVIAQRDLEHRRDRQPENSYDYLSYDGEQEQQSLEKREKIHLMGRNYFQSQSKDAISTVIDD